MFPTSLCAGIGVKGASQSSLLVANAPRPLQDADRTCPPEASAVRHCIARNALADFTCEFPGLNPASCGVQLRRSLQVIESDPRHITLRRCEQLKRLTVVAMHDTARQDVTRSAIEQISPQLVAVYQALRRDGGWLTNHEVAALIPHVSPRTVRAHTRRLLLSGLIEQYELFGGHRYRVLELEVDTSAHRLRERVEEAAEIMRTDRTEVGREQ